MQKTKEDHENFKTEINGVNGIFIQGDYASFYAMQLRHLARYVEQGADHIDFYALNSAKRLIDLLDSCVIVSEDETNE